ncbi:MAG: molybdenum cofactor guanylyltransferase [Gemmatimonadetes bacterium]|nr:molybdenum cofactor guanylyltransferase [Gemmatimonadota bacterium]
MAGPVRGAIIAGGQSTRYGSPKALARVAGRRVVDRVTDALRTVTPDVVAIVNDSALAVEFALPHRSDVHAGAGALGGLHAALAWADEDGFDGVLACACDMPFASSRLLAALWAAGDATTDAVLPESEGPRGLEPLCAWYSTRCVAAIERAIHRRDHRLISFHRDVRVTRLPLEAVRGFGDPARLFANLNTPSDRDRAEGLARSARE